MKPHVFALSLVLAACGNNNAVNNEENSLNVFANNFDACGDEDACADGEECVEYADGERCAPAERPARILLQDTSTGCGDDDSHPGVSLIRAEVDRRDGTLLGRGRVLAEMAGDPVAEDRGLEPDGSVVEADACDDGFNLGCGGWVVVEVVDELGEALALREGQDLRVQIRADVDCDGGAADRFETRVCDDPEAVVGGDTTSCSTPWPLSEDAPGAYSGMLEAWPTP